jgi:PAS domain S-box-containing protein
MILSKISSHFSFLISGKSTSILPAFIIFSTILILSLGLIAYIGQQLLREENQRRTHQLSTSLLSAQIGHELSKRLQVLKTLARNRYVTEVVKGKAEQDNPQIRLALNTANEVAHSELILVFNREGTVISSTNNKSRSLTGFNYAFRPYFQESMSGRDAIFPALGAITLTRGLYISTPIYTALNRQPSGVIALKIPISETESTLQGQTDKTALVSPDGIIFSSNRTDWIYCSTQPISVETWGHLQRTRQFGDNNVRTLGRTLGLNLNSDTITIDGLSHYVYRESLPISGWHVISCQIKDTSAPLPSTYRYVLGSAILVIGGMAFLIFFLAANIQRRRRTELMLRKAEEKYRSIFENATMGIFQSTPEGRFREANASLANMLGYKTSAELMTNIGDIARQIYADPEDRRYFLRNLIEKERVNGFETRLVRKDGEMIWVSISGRMVPGDNKLGDFLEGFCLDITEKKNAEEALRRERDIVSRVMETSPVGIALLNSKGHVTFANSRADNILNLKRDPIPFSQYRKLEWQMADTEGGPSENSESLWAKVLETGKPIQDARVCIKGSDGDQVILSLNIAPLFDNNRNITEMVFVSEDITQQVKAQKEAALRQQQLVLADRMISLGILTSGVAHEINNPNTFILANAQMLANAWQETQTILDQYYRSNGDFLIGGLRYSKFREKFPEMCSRIVEGSRRINRIVQELRGYGRKEAVDLAETFDINEVIRSAEVLMGNMIKKSTNRFELQLEENLPLIKGNFQRLEQVIINILQNACQSLPGRDHRISIQSSVDNDTGSVVVICSDEGVGIPEENLRHITDPFFTTKRDGGGTGLGLFISSNIIREHRGSLNFHSRPGKGTEVIVRLPASISKYDYQQRLASFSELAAPRETRPN